MLICEAWTKYEADKRIEGYSPLTLKMYSYQCDMLKRFVGDVSMEDITTDELKTYLIECGSHLKPSSLRHEKSETTRIYAHLSGKLRHDLYSKYF